MRIFIGHDYQYEKDRLSEIKKRKCEIVQNAQKKKIYKK